MYKDIELKIEYHKENILKEFIKKGIYPNNKSLASRISNIDTNLAIFKHYKVSEGSKFNVEEYNNALTHIMKDIEILYKTCFDLTVIEYNQQQEFINSHLDELITITDMYKKRAEFENSSTTLGKTLLFQNGEFLFEKDNSTTVINLGTVSFEEATTCALFSNIHNAKESDLLFTLTRGDERLSVSPYNISSSTITIPGSKAIESYEFKIQPEQIVNGPLLIDIGEDININNDYTIFGSKNNIFINNIKTNIHSLEEAPSNLGSYTFTDRSYVNFYIVGGNSASFKFSKRPITTNFPLEEPKLYNLNNIHHIFMEVDKDFSFSIELDKGSIYAIKDDGVINSGSLYYTGISAVTDFHILEEMSGSKVDYEVSFNIFNDNDSNFDIESIIIKEMGGV